MAVTVFKVQEDVQNKITLGGGVGWRGRGEGGVKSMLSDEWRAGRDISVVHRCQSVLGKYLKL